MGILEELADGLARDALELEVDEDDPLVNDIGKVIGASSQTLEEAYLTSIRVRRAEKRARELIVARQRQNGG